MVVVVSGAAATVWVWVTACTLWTMVFFLEVSFVAERFANLYLPGCASEGGFTRYRFVVGGMDLRAASIGRLLCRNIRSFYVVVDALI